MLEIAQVIYFLADRKTTCNVRARWMCELDYVPTAVDGEHVQLDLRDEQLKSRTL